MFQLYDFNIVYCAIATVSAAVGYRYTRRRSERFRSSTQPSELHLRSHSSPRRRNSDASQLSSDASIATESDSSDNSSVYCPTPATYESISDVTEPGSLKRKVREDDEVNASEFALNEAALGTPSEPPRKRCRTPSDRAAEPEKEVLEPEHEQVACQAIAMSPVTRIAGDSDPKNSDSPASSISSPVSTAKFSVMPSSFTVPACKPSPAFAAFAGTSSAFTTNAQIGVQKPAWCFGSTGLAVAESTEDPLARSSTGACDSATETTNSTEVWMPQTVVALVGSSTDGDPLAAPAWTKNTHVAITGEEDEDVKAELKGAKLFIKRGDGEFSTGMIGHIKLLSHKTDKSERLVFRRESVWKVSMSVGLRSAVRCSFDEQQGVLRVTLKEAVASDGELSGKQHVVLYALKRGRVPRDDFIAFAEEVKRSSADSSSSTWP